MMLSQLVLNYLPLTNEEIEMWKEDSLKFFMHMRYQSNEVKGNMLRDKAKSLMAGIQLRFPKAFDGFCAQIAQSIK